MERDSLSIPQSSPALSRWFSRYLRWYFGKHFDAVRVSKAGAAPVVDGPLLVYANHPSWWDPILFGLLTTKLFPTRRAYGPMDATALEKYPFFKRLGVFGVERGTHRGAARFLQASEAILSRDDAILWLTAEGSFSDPRRRPVTLQTGVSHLCKRMPRLSVVPLAVEYPFWNERLPEVLLRFGSPVEIPSTEILSLDGIHGRIETALETTMDALSREAQSRNPDRFDTLLLGRAGVGGIYDRWRRWRAVREGRDLVLSHGDRRR